MNEQNPPKTLADDLMALAYMVMNFKEEWRTDTTKRIAHNFYMIQDFNVIKVLGDALQEIGCDDHLILSLCTMEEACLLMSHPVVNLVIGLRLFDLWRYDVSI